MRWEQRARAKNWILSRVGRENITVASTEVKFRTSLLGARGHLPLPGGRLLALGLGSSQRGTGVGCKGYNRVEGGTGTIQLKKAQTKRGRGDTDAPCPRQIAAVLQTVPQTQDASAKLGTIL